MDLEERYSQNRVLLKKINKQSTVNGLCCGLYMFMIVFELYYSVMVSPLFLIMAVLAAAGGIAGFIGIAKKDNRFSAAAVVLVIVHFIAFSVSVKAGIIGMLVSAPGYAVFFYFLYRQIKNNREYHRLEQEDGFPHFEFRQTMYDMDKRQRGIKDPYLIKKEELESRTENAGHMDEL